MALVPIGSGVRSGLQPTVKSSVLPFLSWKLIPLSWSSLSLLASLLLALTPQEAVAGGQWRSEDFLAVLSKTPSGKPILVWTPPHLWSRIWGPCNSVDAKGAVWVQLRTCFTLDLFPALFC